MSNRTKLLRTFVVLGVVALTGLGGISLGGLLPVGLELKIPSLPAQLTTFACP